MKAKETKLNEIIEENKNLSKIAKEFNRKNKICKTTNNNINSLNIAKLPPIEQKNIFDNKENKNNNNLNVSNLSFFKDDHQIKIIKRPAEPNKNETLNFEDNLENLELTSQNFIFFTLKFLFR